MNIIEAINLSVETGKGIRPIGSCVWHKIQISIRQRISFSVQEIMGEWEVEPNKIEITEEEFDKVVNSSFLDSSTVDLDSFIKALKKNVGF